MKVPWCQCQGTWRAVADAARTTIGKEAGHGEPSPAWKKRILLAEHSPIRKLKIGWKWESLKYWVSVHFVRHKIGIEHWVQTQRTDRTGTNRDNKPQDAEVLHECEANVQALINISRKRLCRQAAKETREAWHSVLVEVAKIEPGVVAVCVPECIYRGFCPEFHSCGYAKSSEYLSQLKNYRQI